MDCLPSGMEQGCHPCTLSGSLDTMPSVRLAIIQSAVPSFRLSHRQDRWLACRLARWNSYRIVFMPSGIPALCLSQLPSGADACKQACVTDSAKKQVIPMHSFNAVVWGICWQCLVVSNRVMVRKSYPYFVRA